MVPLHQRHPASDHLGPMITHDELVAEGLEPLPAGQVNGKILVSPTRPSHHKETLR